MNRQLHQRLAAKKRGHRGTSGDRGFDTVWLNQPKKNA